MQAHLVRHARQLGQRSAPRRYIKLCPQVFNAQALTQMHRHHGQAGQATFSRLQLQYQRHRAPGKQARSPLGLRVPLRPRHSRCAQTRAPNRYSGSISHW